MKKQILLSLAFVVAGLFPAFASAASVDDDTTVPGSLSTDSALIEAIASLRSEVGTKITQDSFLVQKYNLIVSRLIETNRLPLSDSIPDVDDINPILFRLIAPPTLYTSPMKRALTLAGDSTATDEGLPASIGLPGEKDLELMDELDHLLLLSYLRNPEKVKQTEERLMENASVSGETMKQSADNAALNVPATDAALAPVTAAANSDMVVKKPNFWKTGGSLSNQWAENYFSTNWYQGGTSNLTILSLLTLDANYNDKQKVTWNNRLEAKVGFYMNNFYKSEEEGRTKIQSNTDLLRFTSTLKLKAIRNWNYSAQLLAYTQMMNMYNGDETLKSTFLSPSYGQFSLGMDWAKTFKKGSLAINIGAITYNFRYVMNDSVLQKSGYIPKEQRKKEAEPTFHHFYRDYGTKVTVDFNYPITKNISYKTRFFYYTPFNAGNSGHHYVQTEWENTFNFQVSKYLSATLFFHARFDDSRKPDEKLKYFMFKEYLTLGFNYSW